MAQGRRLKEQGSGFRVESALIIQFPPIVLVVVLVLDLCSASVDYEDEDRPAVAGLRTSTIF